MAEEFNPRLYEIPTAKAHKVTPVKEGQQYPIGKRGQYKLFQEHVWPKGYSPERMRQVNNLSFEIVPHVDLAEGLPKVGEHNVENVATKLAHSYVKENLARSTAPIEDLKKVQSDMPFTDMRGRTRVTSNPTIFVSHSIPGPNFNAGTNRINFTIDKKYATGADLQRGLMHEVGHAVDFAKDPQRFIDEMKDMKDNPIDYVYGNRPAPPVAEGRAEGFATAHSRITRRDRRVGGNISAWGYSPAGWFFPDAQEAFSKSRNETFHTATGNHLTPPETEKPKGRRPQQLGLFDEQ